MGHDNVPPRALKLVSEELALSLSKMFNTSLELHCKNRPVKVTILKCYSQLK